VLSVIEWRGIIQLVLFSKILVAVDGSDSSNKVYHVAAQLAKLSNGRLIIVHVVLPPSPVGGLFYTDASGLDKLQIDLEESGKKLLQYYSDKSTNEYKIVVETTLAQGYPPDAIIREAETKGADLIVVGSRGFSGAKQFFIGSVPKSVLHHSRISVLLVK
jgi:nucleotide-binding universal stress UspA family protein